MIESVKDDRVLLSFQAGLVLLYAQNPALKGWAIFEIKRVNRICFNILAELQETN